MEKKLVLHSAFGDDDPIMPPHPRDVGCFAVAMGNLSLQSVGRINNLIMLSSFASSSKLSFYYLYLFIIKTNYSSPYCCACGCRIMIIISLFYGAAQVDVKVMNMVLCCKHNICLCLCYRLVFHHDCAPVQKTVFHLSCLTFLLNCHCPDRQEMFISGIRRTSLVLIISGPNSSCKELLVYS